jgi:hypothetical protein
MKREVTRVSNEGGGVEILLDIFFEGRLGFCGPHCVVISREHDALDPFG